jgi:hypothetical protein
MAGAAGDQAGGQRSAGMLRVPFIRRCALEFADGSSDSAFIVNINVLGCYVARDELPPLGQRLRCRFGTPGLDRDVVVAGQVAWLNSRQQHPVHSLPPGFGVKFLDLTADSRRRIEGIVEGYMARQPRQG